MMTGNPLSFTGSDEYLTYIGIVYLPRRISNNKLVLQKTSITKRFTSCDTEEDVAVLFKLRHLQEDVYNYICQWLAPFTFS